MVCLEIILPVVIAVGAVAGAVTAVSEALPFFKKISGNGILHTIYHLIKPDECINGSESSDSIVSLED
tara:strand:- start:2303 stop:2506 length:204 start_codon:yes stop_codon:yes gene_type:complete